jgi:hypothetical protein
MPRLPFELAVDHNPGLATYVDKELDIWHMALAVSEHLLRILLLSKKSPPVQASRAGDGGR